MEPQIDQESRAIATRAEQFAIEASDYQCSDRQTFTVGASQLRQVKDMQKALEERRVSVTGPINEALRTINGWFKTPMDKLKAVESNYKNKMASFEYAERQRIRQEEAEARRRADEERAELERRAVKAAEQGKTEKAEQLIERAVAVVPEAPATAPLKASGIGFSEQWEFEIVDAAKVPREFCMVDEKKIGQYVRAMKDTAEIPGVRIFSRPKVSARGSRF
jgi:hypothetical protein